LCVWIRRRCRYCFPETEVNHFDGAVWGHFDIGWLEIAVHDAALVSSRKALGYLEGHRHHFFVWNRPACNALGQILTGHELHHERARVAFLFKAVNVGDVGMIEGGKHPRLAFEARLAPGIVREQARQDFHRDIPLEGGVAGHVDLTHPASPELGADFVLTYLRANRKAHGAASYLDMELPSVVSRLPEMTAGA
jgi:hypothetical protein